MRKKLNRILIAAAALCAAYNTAILFLIGTDHWFNFAWYIVAAICLLKTKYADLFLVFSEDEAKSMQDVENEGQSCPKSENCPADSTGGKAAVRPLPRPVRLFVYALCAIILASFIHFEYKAVSYSAAPPAQSADYVLVLGAKVNGTVPSQELEARIVKAAEYLKENPDSKAVTTGGKSGQELIAEAEAMAIELQRLGIEPERILTECESKNTRQNMQLSRAVIEADGGSVQSSVLVVSSAFHLYRAVGLAEQAGFTNVSTLGAWGRAILVPHYFAREYAAHIKAVLWETFLQ